MDIQYHPELTARGQYFAFREDEDWLIVECRSCGHRSVNGKHADPLLIRDDMDSHQKDAHPDLWTEIGPAPLSTPSPPPENPA